MVSIFSDLHTLYSLCWKMEIPNTLWCAKEVKYYGYDMENICRLSSYPLLSGQASQVIPDAPNSPVVQCSNGWTRNNDRCASWWLAERHFSALELQIREDWDWPSSWRSESKPWMGTDNHLCCWQHQSADVILKSIMDFLQCLPAAVHWLRRFLQSGTHAQEQILREKKEHLQLPLNHKAWHNKQ